MRQTYDRSWCDYCWGRWDRSADCTEVFSIRMPAFGDGWSPTLRVPEDSILSIVVLATAFMRGGAIDYYSNNVQVAHDGALAKVGVKAMFRSFKSITIPLAARMSWQMLSKATKDSKTALNWPLKVKTDGQEKVKSEASKSGNRYYLGVTNGLKTGLWINSCLVYRYLEYSDTDFGSFWRYHFHFSLNKLGGPVAIYNASSQAAQLGIQQSYLLWLCSLLILGSSI